VSDDQQRASVPEWYCPYTKSIVAHPRRGLLCHRCEQGHRIIRLEQPFVSSDIAAIGAIAAAMMFSAVLLWLGGYLIVVGQVWWKVAAGYALGLIAIGFPFYEAIASIRLGRVCKDLDGLPSVIAWVSMAKGAGLITGAGLVLICVLYLIASGTVHFVYSGGQ
jgi:hypothetical protein